MFKYYNPHPCGRITDDCVKRAITVVTGWDYMRVQRELNAYKRAVGAKAFNSPRALKFVEDVLGAKRIELQGKMSVKKFCSEHPFGRFILDLREHWSACVDGIIYDTWNCSDEYVNFVYEYVAKNAPSPDVRNQIFRYCCTSEEDGCGNTIIKIYDGNGSFVTRVVKSELAAGYILCLEDRNYFCVEL